MRDQFVDCQELELVTPSDSNQEKPVNSVSLLGQLWYWLIESIIAANELKIYSHKTKFGSAYWGIYDPVLERKVYCDSEAEVREYLDR